MYKKKYLKYKKKYIDFKLQIGGIEHYINYDKSNKLTPLTCKDDIEKKKEKNFMDNFKFTIFSPNAKYDNIYFNVALRIYNIEKVLCLLQKNFFNFFNFDNIDLLSIGSGNGLFESLCQQIFGIPILCVDPYPLGFMRFKLKEPFIKPMFNYTVNYLQSKTKKDETVLFLIWPEPSNEVEDELPYDLEAIFLLKPLAFFIIYSNRGFIAGSRQLRELIVPKDIFKVGHQTYQKKLQRNVIVKIKGTSVISLGHEAVINIALFVNDSKYKKLEVLEEDKSKFYKPQFIENYDEVDEETIELGYYNPDVS